MLPEAEPEKAKTDCPGLICMVGLMRFLSSLSPFEILRQLRKGQESSTFERLGGSRHVADLRLIFSVTIIIMIAASILALVFCFELRVMTTWPEIQSSHSGWIWARLALSSIADSGVFIGAIGAVGCGVLAWTYQAGSARLGVVDLFACEIATLCRVAAVIDMVQRYIDLFHTGPEMPLPHRPMVAASLPRKAISRCSIRR